MKTQQPRFNISRFVQCGFIFIMLTGCASALDNSSSNTSGGSATANLSDETDTEATYTAAIQAVIDSSSSTASDAGSASASVSTSYLTAAAPASVLGFGPRFRCADSDSVEHSFSCDNSDGSVTRDVTFTDCLLENDFREVTLNGSFTNTVENGGDGFCNADDSFNLGKMVMGRDAGPAVHNHETDESGMVRTFLNRRGKTVTVTTQGLHVFTYTDPVDDNADGIAESVTATIERDGTMVHEIDGRTVHDVNVFTTDEDFYSIASGDYSADDAAESDTETLLYSESDNSSDDSDNATADDSDASETGTLVEVSLPVHELVFDEEGRLESRTIVSGQLIVDHNLAQIRSVFGVGEEGLTFDDGTTCGPVSGTMTVTQYAINDDGSIGEIAGTGEVVFADGEVQSASFDGQVLRLRPQPCE